MPSKPTYSIPPAQANHAAAQATTMYEPKRPRLASFESKQPMPPDTLGRIAEFADDFHTYAAAFGAHVDIKDQNGWWFTGGVRYKIVEMSLSGTTTKVCTIPDGTVKPRRGKYKSVFVYEPDLYIRAMWRSWNDRRGRKEVNPFIKHLRYRMWNFVESPVSNSGVPYPPINQVIEDLDERDDIDHIIAIAELIQNQQELHLERVLVGGTHAVSLDLVGTRCDEWWGGKRPAMQNEEAELDAFLGDLACTESVSDDEETTIGEGDEKTILIRASFSSNTYAYLSADSYEKDSPFVNLGVANQHLRSRNGQHVRPTAWRFKVQPLIFRRDYLDRSARPTDEDDLNLRAVQCGRFMVNMAKWEFEPLFPDCERDWEGEFMSNPSADSESIDYTNATVSDVIAVTMFAGIEKSLLPERLQFEYNYSYCRRKTGYALHRPGAPLSNGRHDGRYYPGYVFN